MKSYRRLGLIILLALGLSCITAPWVWYLLQYLRGISPEFRRALDWPFYRVMSRVVLVWAIILLYRNRRKLEVMSLAAMGLKRSEGWGSLLCRGWILGACSLALMVLVMMPCGARRVFLDFAGLGDLAWGVFLMFLSGLVVGFIEEIFFRGFILQSLLGDMRRWRAIAVMSLFFAIVHFFKANDMPRPPVFAPYAGFKAIYYYFRPLLQPADVIPGFVGLFLVGVVLACAFLWTGSLYLSIGLHAGWVFGIKAEGLFLEEVRDSAQWFFGDGYVVTGVFGWLMLLVMLLIVKHVAESLKPAGDIRR